MKKLAVCFLWHMHQPNYLDPIREYYSMPWVRLHATKAYYDMAILAQRYPEMGLTFNLVPSLLEQLEDYANGAEDYELMLSKKNPVDLTLDEKEAILSRFFQANLETMIKPFPRYIELLQNRGMKGTRSDIDKALSTFAAQDYLDLQVLFNLCWFGYSAINGDQDLKRLISRGRLFSSEDKELVLEKQHDIISKIPRLYKDLWETGSIDITVSPFYHPILPLLCTTDSALTAMPNCLLPQTTFSHPEDAERQVIMAQNYCERLFGRQSPGMWPSEGSVSPETLEIFHKAGISWTATDEEILARSAKKFDRNRDLYKPWQAHGVSVFFRDHSLSDLIGFVYARNTANVAVDDFIGRLKGIASSGDRSSRCVSIILDGENPWETYHNSGKDFLETLYAKILAEKDLQPTTFSSYLKNHPPDSTISSIFPGSWINGNFDTWIGDLEEVNGWDALKNARDALSAREKDLTDSARAEAWREIYRAEGSDWFWWYGEDHSSPNDEEFDRLFRAHLERVYTILGMKPPLEVTEPILIKQMVRADVEPTGFVTPVIDGKSTTFYEWLSAGWVPTTRPGGVMSGSEPLISSIYYGFDMTSLSFRFDFFKREEPLDFSQWKISIIIENSEKYRIDIDLGKPESYVLFRESQDKWARRSRRSEVALDKTLELSVSYSDIGADSGMRMTFIILVYENDIEREHWPVNGYISFIVPDEKFQSLMWQL